MYEQRVVHVRGTPSSGKIILAELLEDYYDRRKQRVVLFTDWSNNSNPWEYLVRECRVAGYDYLDTKGIQHRDIIFIIDEAQASYNDSIFWLQRVKKKNGRDYGSRICLFASYGSPVAGPTRRPEKANTPVESSKMSCRSYVCGLTQGVPLAPRLGTISTSSQRATPVLLPN